MSLSVFFSRNLHQLLNNLGSNSTIKFLKLQYCTCKQVHVWRFNLQNSVLANEARLGLQSLVFVRAWSNKTTKLKSRKLSTNRATPCKIEKRIVRASTINSKNQPAFFQPKTVNCHGFQQSTSVRKAIDWPATILVFDIETTGFSRRKERIIEFALRDLIGGKDSTFETLVNPEIPVSNTHAHGIRSYMVNRTDVPTFRELVPILLQYVRSRRMPGKPVLLVAHNAEQFDVPFITNEFQRCSMDIPEDWGFLDTLPLARRLVMPDGSKLPSVSLESLREHYGIPLAGPAHRAMPDATVLCNVLQRITFDLKLTVSQLLDLAFRPKRNFDVPP
ncbi:exonuclease DPD1, chloroplastic/mitochondrial-like [Curcuma longa]|uniref:exonuclease DPD1, chloroplastic/mitochondrial-like n=1 Tax=Curcuma longa TaxID=136217 RepID=UPI003D9DB1DC